MSVSTGRGLTVVWPAAGSGTWDAQLLDDAGRDLALETLELTVHLDVQGRMTAELLMLTDVNGNMAAHRGPVVLNPSGGYCRDRFSFVVTEMRMAND